MTVTTGGAASAGINWQAVIYAQVALGVEPYIGQTLKPTMDLNLQVNPTIGMQPPALVNLFITPYIGLARSTKASARFNLTVSPTITVGKEVSASFRMSVTPSMSFGGRRNYKGRQVGIAVQRAATI
jgi:hypothetical protein